MFHLYVLISKLLSDVKELTSLVDVVDLLLGVHGLLVTRCHWRRRSPRSEEFLGLSDAPLRDCEGDGAGVEGRQRVDEPPPQEVPFALRGGFTFGPTISQVLRKRLK